MLKNYVNIILRKLWRNKTFTLINLAGLSVGLTCFSFISFYVNHELSFDKFHKKEDRIFRVTGILELEGQGEKSASCPFPLGPALANDYPQWIENSVRLFNFQDPQHSLRKDEIIFNESGLYLVDSAFFKVFDYKLIKGNPNSALDAPGQIVINQKLAKKYFGDNDPMGQILRFDGISDLMVTGILAESPQPSHLSFEGLISFSTIESILPNISKNWVWNPCWTYIQFKDKVSPDELESVFPAFIQKYYPDFLKNQVTHKLQSLKNIHLDSHLDYEMNPNSDRNLVYIFSIIGLIILGLACVNYNNLSTATAAGRAREIAIRKVSGASLIQLRVQFLSESIILALLASFLSLTWIEILLPHFSTFAEKDFSHLSISNIYFIYLLPAGLISGIISGIYPALLLSSFSTAKTLKGNSGFEMKGGILRKTLVTFQFSVSMILFIATGVAFDQFQFLMTKDLGFEKSNIILMPVRPPMATEFVQFIPQIEQIPGVVKVATANDIIGKSHNTHEYNYEGLEQGKWKYFPTLLVDENYISMSGIQLITGRDFSKTIKREDSLSVIVNEKLVKEMGWGSPETAIGKRFSTPHGWEKVIGVVKNFNADPLNKEITPFVLDMPHITQKNYWTRYIYIRLNSPESESIIQLLKNKWNSLSLDFPFEYQFLDQTLDGLYKTNKTLVKLVGLFAVLAAFIACLGLFGLVSFTAHKRTKEIGIRKILGASQGAIIWLLLKEFLSLLGISILISFPLAGFLMNLWLNSFAFHTELNWIWFPLAALGIFIVSISTVILNTIKTANLNPVDTLNEK